MPAWNEASVRSEGFMNSSPSILPAQRVRLGRASPGAARARAAEHLVAREIGQIEEATHAMRLA